MEPAFLSISISNEGKQKREFFENVSTNTKLDDTISTPSSNTESGDLTQIFKLVGNSIVKVSSKDQQVLGSGFVYSKEGHIITNNHVVQTAEIFDVIFSDRNAYTAKVVGKDPYSDIAVLQIIDDFLDQDVVPLPIGNSSSIEVGQQIIAIGNPLGFSNTMTTGIVSQIGRLLPADSEIEGGFVSPNVIQTDAVINPGNSGGPMLDTKGEVIGINTSIFSPTGVYAGIGFAIPSNAITRIVPALIQEGHYDHAWLGFTGDSLYPDLAESLGFPRNYKGVLVESVDVGGPGSEVGLRGTGTATTSRGNSIGNTVGDILIALDGQTIKGIEDVIVFLEEQKTVGENIVITVNRNGETLDLNAILEPRPVNTN
jgi:S1-C subfamily serine protease